MKKRFAAMLMTLVLMLALLPASSLAKSKQMNDDVPVWTEETVKTYAQDYIGGRKMDILYGYYDLQIRRYMPMNTFVGMLTELKWMTGDFLGFGTYTSFEEPKQKTKTHILHLCMEKQDMDLYFTHKDKEDDWEIMAVEFIPSEKQQVNYDGEDMIVTEEEPTYIEVEVTVGEAPYTLRGILTLPDGAGAEKPVTACVLVHGSGPSDMDESVGETKVFRDIARAFAQSGIATLRYDKRTYSYGASMTPDEIAAITVEEETIQDAISAGKLLKGYEGIDGDSIILVGHSMGAMLAPRIATEAEGLFAGILMIAGTPKTLLQIMIDQNQAAIAQMDPEQQAMYNQQLEPIIQQVEALSGMTAEEAKATQIFGQNAYYFWEMQQHDPISLIKTLKVPVYIVQGSEDFQVPVESGVDAYEDALGDDLKHVSFKVFRGLNHLMMAYTGAPESKGSLAEYDTPATLDQAAVREMVEWIKKMNQEDE